MNPVLAMLWDQPYYPLDEPNTAKKAPCFPNPLTSAKRSVASKYKSIVLAFAKNYNTIGG